MPHSIIEISELSQLVADFLLFLHGQQSLVSLACTCRALEEQALSALWSEQSSLETLVRSTLPPGILSSPQFPPQPTRAEWDRFRRYASWMRRLRLEPRSDVPGEVLHMISDNLPNGILFPGLRDLSWTVQPHTLPFYRLFLSPNLTEFLFSYVPLYGVDTPVEIFPTITSMIMELETLHLRVFRFFLRCPAQRCRSLEPAFSSAVLRCGPSLKILSVPTPLSDAAVQHIMQLPNLTEWYTMNGPPRVSDLSLSGAFLKLDLLQLCEEASLGWLPLFEVTARRTSSTQDAHIQSYHGPGQNLTTLECLVDVSVGAALVTPIMLFHGLTDDDTEEITTALPRLKEAVFGWVCSVNSCRTTVSSLISFSTHCEDLVYLEIHFNTTNLRNNLEPVLADLRLDNLPSSSERDPFILSLSDAPISISREDIGPVMKGFHRIFPSLDVIHGRSPALEELNARLTDEV